MAFKSDDRHTTHRFLETMRSVYWHAPEFIGGEGGQMEVNGRLPRFNFVPGSNVENKSWKVVTIHREGRIG